MAEPRRGLQRRRSSSGASSRVLQAAMNAIKGETGSDVARHVQLNTGHAPKTWKGAAAPPCALGRCAIRDVRVS